MVRSLALVACLIGSACVEQPVDAPAPSSLAAAAEGCEPPPAAPAPSSSTPAHETPSVPVAAEPEPDAAHPTPAASPGSTRGQRDATVTSFDGTTIALTLFTPDLAPGESAPLIVHSHGWGGSRLTDLDDPGLLARAPEEAAALAREAGYFVISFDQRGFGESGGDAMVMSPAFEGRDISAVLDWAEAELGPALARDATDLDDPRVGALGLSYGGGFQLVGAAVDHRFDALVPTATWHYLPYSLAPNGVPKNAWIDVLMGIGVPGAKGHIDPVIYQAFVQSQTSHVSDEVLATLAPNGLHDYCRAGEVPTVDAFFVQGLTDTLFNVNEAVMNADCLRAAGNDVRLLVQRHGHILPVLQDGDGTIGFDVDARVQCGEVGFDVAPAMVSFLDEKLRGRVPAVDIPPLCVVQDDSHGVVMRTMPRGGVAFDIDQRVTSPLLLELVLEVLRERPLLDALELVSALPPDVLRTLTLVLTGLSSPATLQDSALAIADALPDEVLNEALTASRWIPLHSATAIEDIVGIPTIDGSITATSGLEPLAFVGIGVQRSGQVHQALLDDQVSPLRGAGDHQQDLVAVSARLLPGDTVGLLIYGFHPQYLNALTLHPGAFRLRGRVALPIAPH